MFGVWIGLEPGFEILIMFLVYFLCISYLGVCVVFMHVYCHCVHRISNSWSFFQNFGGFFFWYYGCIFGILPFSNGLKENVKRF